MLLHKTELLHGDTSGGSNSIQISHGIELSHLPTSLLLSRHLFSYPGDAHQAHYTARLLWLLSSCLHCDIFCLQIKRQHPGWDPLHCRHCTQCLTLCSLGQSTSEEVIDLPIFFYFNFTTGLLSVRVMIFLPDALHIARLRGNDHDKPTLNMHSYPVMSIKPTLIWRKNIIKYLWKDFIKRWMQSSCSKRRNNLEKAAGSSSLVLFACIQQSLTLQPNLIITAIGWTQPCRNPPDSALRMLRLHV